MPILEMRTGRLRDVESPYRRHRAGKSGPEMRSARLPAPGPRPHPVLCGSSHRILPAALGERGRVSHKLASPSLSRWGGTTETSGGLRDLPTAEEQAGLPLSAGVPDERRPGQAKGSEKSCSLGVGLCLLNPVSHGAVLSGSPGAGVGSKASVPSSLKWGHGSPPDWVTVCFLRFFSNEHSAWSPPKSRRQRMFVKGRSKRTNR